MQKSGRHFSSGIEGRIASLPKEESQFPATARPRKLLDQARHHRPKALQHPDRAGLHRLDSPLRFLRWLFRPAGDREYRRAEETGDTTSAVSIFPAKVFVDYTAAAA